MAFPDGWPPRPATAVRSIRVLITGTTSSSFEDNAYLFYFVPGANTIDPTPYVAPGSTQQTPIGSFLRTSTPQGGGNDIHNAAYNQHISFPYGGELPPCPMLWCGTLSVTSEDSGADLEFSFDGTYAHGVVPGDSYRTYRNRYEAGIAVRIRGALATGSIATVAVANLVDGETVVIDDGVNAAVTFEFDDDGSVVETDTLRSVDISAITTADEVRDALIAAITNAPVFLITATSGGAATVTLSGLRGTTSNIAITHTVADPGFSVSGMSGATGTAGDFIIEAW